MNKGVNMMAYIDLHGMLFLFPYLCTLDEQILHNDSSAFTSLRNPTLMFIMASQYIYTNKIKEFSFLHISSKTFKSIKFLIIPILTLFSWYFIVI